MTQAGPRYKLTATHYIGGQLLPEGMEIGEGTAVPFDGKPSMQMVPLNEAAEAAVKALGDRGDPVASLPATGGF